MMTDQIQLYISATPELERERDAINRAVTAIPTSLGWVIVQTPYADQPINPQAIVRADVHLLILGSDIKAPVGLEWQIATRAGRSPILFKQDTLHTPAASVFVRELAHVASWRTYQALADLHLAVSNLMADHIASRAMEYALTAAEVERLRAWQKELSSTVKRNADETSRDASASAIVFSPERYTPSTGQPLA
jgi:hypothetical protein